MNKLFSYLLIISYSLVFSQNELTHNVYFDTDKYEISSIEKNRLLLFISTLANVEIESISILGFCDDIGDKEYNLNLSKKRAEAIKIIFLSKEISPFLIKNVNGKGEILLKIVNKKNILKIRKLNRKVAIIVKPKPLIKKEEKIVVNTVKKKNITQHIKGELKVGDKIIFKNILFKIGYATVTPSSKKTLESIAKSLVERNDIYFTIQGHVCCTQLNRDAVDKKTKKRNLSEARAKYVYDYFVKKGVDKKRMRYLGLGRKFPLGGDPKFDRRVEILITYIGD